MKRKKKKLQLAEGKNVDTGTSTLGAADVSVGCLVEFLLPSKASAGPTVDIVPASRLLGIIARPAGKRKWWVEDADGNEHLVNRFQLTYQFPTEYIGELLPTLQKKVQQAADLISLEPREMWGKALEQFQGEAFSASDLAEVLYGEGALHSKDSVAAYILYRIMNQHEKYFRKASIHGFYVRSKSDVKMFENDLEKRLREQQLIFRFVTTMKEILRLLDIGETETADEIVFAEEDIKYLEALKQYALNETSNNVVVAEQILKPLGIGRSAQNVFELLKRLRVFGEFENPYIVGWKDYQLDIGEEQVEYFTKSILSNPIYDDVKHLRRHFSHPVFTIADRNGCHRVGWSIMNEQGDEWVIIHVTDPTRFLNPNTDLDLIFRQRAQSISLPEVSFTMFPEELQDELGFRVVRASSGNEQAVPLYIEGGKPNRKVALSFAIKPQRDGRVLDYKIYYSYLDTNQIYNLSLTEADAIILGDENAMTDNSNFVREKFFQEWISIEQFAERRRKYRVRHDAVALKIPKASVKIVKERQDSQGHAFRIDLTPENEYNNALGVLQEFDLMLGEMAGSFCAKWDIPMVYKSQPPIPLELDFKASRDPLEDRIKQEALDKLYRRDRSNEKVIDQISKKNSLPPEVYSATPKKHYGYALTCFAPIANPMNDYYHFLNQHQVKHAVLVADWNINAVNKRDDQITEPTPVTPFNYNAIINTITTLQTRKHEMNLLQINSNRFWILWSIKQDVNENAFTQYEGLVIVARDDRNETTILVRHYELEHKMTTRRNFSKGEKLLLRVEHVDPFYDRLILKEAKKGL